MSKIYNQFNDIKIIGGGSAGWMTATTLIKQWPNKKITLIESPNHPTIGVGESTINGIGLWLESVGLNKNLPFLKDSDGTIKLSIRFEDFYRKGDGGFHYPFGQLQVGGLPNFTHDWHIKKALYPDTPITDFANTYYSQMALVNENVLTKDFPGFNYNRDKAVHFDAIKFGQYLKDKVCIPNGVEYILKEVKDVNLDDEGNVDNLILDDGEKITADLWIDCTGFKSLLLDKTLKEPFIDMSSLLPNNSAWATKVPYKDKKKEICNYTNCTALNNGWVWQIPLWSRWGTGYVYSDKYVSDENALQEFKNFIKSKDDDLEFKKIRMRVGRHKRIWVKNVIAIGLSAGFVEPLESNGLYSVHEFLKNLVCCLESRNPYYNNIDRSNFNFQCGKLFDNFARFVTLHYALSARDDTEYWKDVQRRDWEEIDPYPDGSDVHFWKYKWRQYWNDNKWYLNEGLNCIGVGFHWHIWGWNKQKTALNNQGFFFDENTIDSYKPELQNIIRQTDMRRMEWNVQAEKCENTYEFLRKNFYNDEYSKIK